MFFGVLFHCYVFFPEIGAALRHRTRFLSDLMRGKRIASIHANDGRGSCVGTLKLGSKYSHTYRSLGSWQARRIEAKKPPSLCRAVGIRKGPLSCTFVETTVECLTSIRTSTILPILLPD